MQSSNRRTTIFNRSGRCSGVAVLTLGALLLGSGPALGHAADGHPAKIHEGTCEALGKVAFSLIGVGASVDADDQPIATPAAVNPDAAYQVMESETNLPDLTLDELLAAPHAVMVYESDEDLTGISCGNLGGALLDGELAMGLGEIGGAGHTGIVLFAAADDGVNIDIYIGHALSLVPSQSGTVAVNQSEDNHEEDGHTHDEDDDHADGEATPAAN